MAQQFAKITGRNADNLADLGLGAGRFFARNIDTGTNFMVIGKITAKDGEIFTNLDNIKFIPLDGNFAIDMSKVGNSFTTSEARSFINTATTATPETQLKGVSQLDAIARGSTDVNDAEKLAGTTDTFVKDANNVAGNDNLFKRMGKFAYNNPGTTIGGIIFMAIGAYGIISSIDGFEKSNGKSVNIIKSYKGASSKLIVIQYDTSSDATIVEDDKITINGANFTPSLDGRQFKVLKSTDDTITIEYDSIEQYATSGTLTIHTSIGNRVVDTTEKAAEESGSLAGKTAKAAGGVAGEGIGAFFENLFGDIKPYIMGCIICIVVIIIISIVFKIIK